MSATTTLSPRIRQGRRTVTRPWRSARLIAAAAIVVAGFGTAAAVDRSSSVATTCTAHDPATGAAITGPISVVAMGSGGEVVIPERAPAGHSGAGNRVAVFCGGALSNIEWISNG